MPKQPGTLEKLYTVGELGDYFGVTQSTVLRWINQWQETKDSAKPQGLRAGKLNGVWRSKESWVKKYAAELYPEGKSA